MRIAITTLGCKANQYDSEVIRQSCENNRFTIVPSSGEADVYIVNTCTVTGSTDYQSRQLIRKIHRRHPSAIIVVTGCYAQVSPEEIKKIPGVSLVLGNVDKDTLVEKILHSIHPDEQVHTQAPKESAAVQRGPTRFATKTRFFLKIQDGCNSRCTYCIIPTARGRSRSMAPGEVIRHLSNISQSGHKEVVLTGIHLGAYGLDLTPPTTLFKLLEDLENARPIIRLRLSSIEPNEIDDRLIRFIAVSDLVCPHLHLPLQSGSDTVLRRMNRRYSAGYFHDTIKSLAQAIPDIALGVDVIVGFPGESDDQFKETLELIHALPVTYLHVFPFSPRAGTPAASFPDRVHGDIVKERARILRQLSTAKREQFYGRFAGQTMPVLIESSRNEKTGLLKGFSRNYVPVLLDGPDGLMNREIEVRIREVNGVHVKGTLLGVSNL